MKAAAWVSILGVPLITGCTAKPLVAPPPPPSVVSTVSAAKKVFLSNKGADRDFLAYMGVGADGSYKALSAALKQWGHFQLVDSPSQADLVFEIYSTDVTTITERSRDHNTPVDEPDYHPMFNLTILDAKTQAGIWKIESPAGRGSKPFAQSMVVLMGRIQALVVPAAPVSTSGAP